MKTYEETVDTVFDRINQYHIHQKRKQKVLIGCTAVICSICLTTALGIFLTRDINNFNKPMQSLKNTDFTNSPNPTEIQIDNPTQADKENKILIHHIDNLVENRMDIGLFCDDYVPMTLEQMNAYYGSNIIADVPTDLTTWEGESYGIYKREKGTGEIYWDQNIQNFSNEESSRNLLIETAKGRLPFHCCIVFDPETESSVIKGEDVAIGITDNGNYCVWFMHNDVGFYIFADGITEEELISVIESLVQ